MVVTLQIVDFGCNNEVMESVAMHSTAMESAAMESAAIRSAVLYGNI